MKQDPSRRPVSVDDLLRVKRGERPDGRFWSDWQGDMRRRLATEKASHRPWWKDALPKFWISVAKWQTPVGVTALLLLGFITTLEYRRAFPPLESAAPLSASSAVAISPETGLESSSLASSGSLSAPASSALASSARTPLPGELTGLIAMAGYVRDQAAGPSMRLVDAALAGVIAPFPSRSRQSAAPSESADSIPQTGRGHLLGFAYGQPSAGASQSVQVASRVQPSQVDGRLHEGLTRRALERMDGASLRF